MPYRTDLTNTEKLYYAIFQDPPSKDISLSDIPELLAILSSILSEYELSLFQRRFGIEHEQMARPMIVLEDTGWACRHEYGWQAYRKEEDRLIGVENRALKRIRKSDQKAQIELLFTTDIESAEHKSECIDVGDRSGSIVNLPLSNRTVSCLIDAGVTTVRDLADCYSTGLDITRIAGFGPMAFKETERILVEIGVPKMRQLWTRSYRNYTHSHRQE